MRIGTWNVAQKVGDLAAQDAEMDKVGADVWVLTEIGHQRRKRMSGCAVCSAPYPHPSSSRLNCWVAVTGPGAEPVGPPLPYERLAAAARVVISGQPVIVTRLPPTNTLSP